MSDFNYSNSCENNFERDYVIEKTVKFLSCRKNRCILYRKHGTSKFAITLTCGLQSTLDNQVDCSTELEWNKKK